MEDNCILKIKGIEKNFSGVKALSGVSFDVKRGTIHGLIGENGAGKSTLMKIVIGILKFDAGEIIFDGKKINFSNTAAALKAGIAMVHQELMPVPELSVAENLYLGREPTGLLGKINHKKLYNNAQNLFSSLKLELDARAKMKDISIAQRQLVEIAKAVSNDAKLIIMDEPTSAITNDEVEKLFSIIYDLKAKGVTIIYISHKMDELFSLTDELTVLRDGTYIGTVDTKITSEGELIKMMVGRSIEAVFPKIQVELGETILEVKNLWRKGAFEDVSFSLKKGEILGVAGLVGAGRSEVMRAIFGIDKLDSGEIFLNGKKIEIRNPADAIKNKIAFLSEDRKNDGLFLMHSVSDNMAVSSLNKLEKGKSINKQAINIAKEQVELLNIKTPHVYQTVNNLSGGNQQKVLISKWLLTEPDIIILDEPTRGIDVGAKSEIHRLMGEMVQRGKSVIMVSSELPEILGMSDRILVMHEGKLSGILDMSEATQGKIMHYAFGLV